MSKPGLISTDMTMAQALSGVVARYGSRVALVASGERITYRQLYDGAQALASSFVGLGLRPGDRVVTLLWNGPESAYAFFAAAMLGAVIVPLPLRMRRHEMDSFLRELQPALIIATPDLEVEGGLDGLRTLRNELHSLHGLVITGPPRERELAFGNLLAESPMHRIMMPAEPRDQLAILYTSGTTGRARGVVHSHRSLIAPVVASLKLRETWMAWPNLGLLGRWLRVLMRYGVQLLAAVGRQQVIFSTIPMHTIAGLEAMLQALLMGDRLVLLPRFHPVRALEAIRRERVTVLIAVPMAYVAMMRCREFAHYRHSSLLICATGSAPCSPELAREIRRRFGCAVHIGFGLTEVGGGIAATSLEDSTARQAETVGQPMPGMEVRIVDDERRPLPPGAVGELACRSDGLMLGYLGEQSGQGAVVDGHGWLYTGDLAVMDAKGYVRIVGRKKDMIIRGGQNIHPARIEAHLATMLHMREAIVVGVPDQLGGESVWAFVIPEPGTQMSEKDVLVHCRAALEAYEVPQCVRVVADVPRASNGKPQKYKLREIALKELQTHDQST